jgi:uncharacterized protein YjbI with pentapeptide repeats
MSNPFDTHDQSTEGGGSTESVVATPEDDTATKSARGTKRRPRGELPADLRDTDLKGWDLGGLDLSGRDLSGANLTDADLKKTILFKANLSGASLRRADMRGAECTGADFTGAFMEEIQGEGAGFGMTSLRDAELFSANLDGATLSKADLSGADLRTASLRRARVREAVLVNADLTSAKLDKADLALCDVAGATFNNASMREARLRAVRQFEKAQWYGVDTHDINFAGAYRIRRHIIDENYLKEFRESGPWSRALYRLWWITGNCGRSVGRWLAWVVMISVIFRFLYQVTEVDYGLYHSWISPWYFSVVTLTTLGYGDAFPASTGAKLLAITEVGIGYVMLGGLLSIFANKIARRGE